MRKLRLQAGNILLKSLPIYFAHMDSTHSGWSESSLFPSYTASRTAFLTLVKSTFLKSQNFFHPTSLHSEILMFPYIVPLLENYSVFSFFNPSSLPFIDFVKILLWGRGRILVV